MSQARARGPSSASAVGEELHGKYARVATWVSLRRLQETSAQEMGPEQMPLESSPCGLQGFRLFGLSTFSEAELRVGSKKACSSPFAQTLPFTLDFSDHTDGGPLAAILFESVKNGFQASSVAGERVSETHRPLLGTG